MKFKLLLLVIGFIPTLCLAAGALMQLEVPEIAQPVISEIPKINNPNLGGHSIVVVGYTETSQEEVNTIPELEVRQTEQR
jgi:hypothetical protein